MENIKNYFDLTLSINISEYHSKKCLRESFRFICLLEVHNLLKPEHISFKVQIKETLPRLYFDSLD